MDQTQKWSILIALGIVLTSAGCGGLGGGFSELESGVLAAFDQGGSSEASSNVVALAGSSSASGGSGAPGVTNDLANNPIRHNPEPASLMLFGSGLALFSLRRRKMVG